VQGPLDSVRTGEDGGFAFRFAPDTASLYLLSARWSGIEYFSPPVHTNPERADTGIVLVVADTSARQPVTVEARHVVVNRPGSDGSRRMLEIVVLSNPGPATRVAPDSTAPSLALRLPAGAAEFGVGDTEVAPEALEQHGDSVVLYGPIPPGERQLVYRYTLPSGARAEIPMAEGAASANVLVEEREARVSGGTIAAADTAVVEGRTYRRWSGSVPAGETLRIALPGTSRADSRLVLAALVAAVVAALAFVAWRVLRQRGRAAGAVAAGTTAGPADASTDDPNALLDALAALDARFAGRRDAVPASEWTGYERERAALKERLRHALAAGAAQP
jgi:hypothetical protein